MSEYLKFNPPEWFEQDIPTARDLAETKRILGVAMLAQIMKDATLQLVSTPGPHLWERQNGVGSWVLWWADYFDQRAQGEQKLELVNTTDVASLEEIAMKVKKLKSTSSSGVLLAATAEGTDGHRFAIDWMKDCVSFPILLLEDEGYFQRQTERRKPFFPTSIRLSMWAMYGVMTGLIPDKPQGLDEGNFYDNLVHHLGVDYSFASSEDPHAETKIRRGKREAFFTKIPEWMSVHTSDRTQKLM